MTNLTTCPPAVHPDPADLAVIDEPSPADLAWIATLNADWHTAEPTPLAILDDSAPFDEDAPEPPSWDELYRDRRAEHAIAFGIFGHPATEEW